MLHERPGHLMLTSAFHDLTDIARLELQPLRSTISSSEPEEAALGDSKGNNALYRNAATPGRFDQLESAASKDKQAGEARQQGRIRSNCTALHSGRNDSAADFGVTHAPGSSGQSSLAVSTCDSQESELLSIREQGPDQAGDGHSLAEDMPDHKQHSHNSSSFCAIGPSSTSVSVNPEPSCVFEQAASKPPNAAAPALTMNGSSATAWVTEHDTMLSARPPDAQYCNSSMPAAPQPGQPDRQTCLQDVSSSAGRAQRPGFIELYRAAARRCRGVPWSLVGLHTGASAQHTSQHAAWYP